MLHPHMKSMNTFTDVFDFVAFRLMNAGWLRMYSIGSKEYAMEWSNKGSGRAALIRPIVAEFGLGGGADVVSRFTRNVKTAWNRKTMDSGIAAGCSGWPVWRNCRWSLKRNRGGLW